MDAPVTTVDATIVRIERLMRASKELVDSVSFDENGRLIGGKWVGGNGGLLSPETHAKADGVRRALAALGGAG